MGGVRSEVMEGARLAAIAVVTAVLTATVVIGTGDRLLERRAAQPAADQPRLILASAVG
jgi:uncharacterized membrane protein